MMPRSHETNYGHYSFWKKPVCCGFISGIASLLAGFVMTDINNNLMKGIFFIGWAATFGYTARQCFNERAEEDIISIRYGTFPRMRP